MLSELHKFLLKISSIHGHKSLYLGVYNMLNLDTLYMYMHALLLLSDERFFMHGLSKYIAFYLNFSFQSKRICYQMFQNVKSPMTAHKI